MNQCVNCLKDTTNPKFCSRSCSVSYNNKKSPKRVRQRKCGKDGCNNFPKSHSHRCCEEHSVETGDRNIGYYRNMLSTKDRHKSWLHAHVRGLCRSSHKALTKLPCLVCGYIKHVELCHIKPINSFPDDAKIKDVNSINNVVQLCRNCHWELDNGVLDLIGVHCPP